MSEAELELVARHLGHDAKTDKVFYRLSHHTLELSKVALGIIILTDLFSAIITLMIDRWVWFMSNDWQISLVHVIICNIFPGHVLVCSTVEATHVSHDSFINIVTCYIVNSLRCPKFWWPLTMVKLTSGKDRNCLRYQLTVSISKYVHKSFNPLFL